MSVFVCVCVRARGLVGANDARWCKLCSPGPGPHLSYLPMAGVRLDTHTHTGPRRVL